MLIRWVSIVFFTTITLLGITGNSLIIYSSARYNAINLDEVSVKFVRNLAVADLLYTMVGILPPCISSIMDADPSLNPFRVYMWLCKTCYYAKHVAGAISLWTIMCISLHRITVVLLPLREIVTVCVARTTLTVMWVVATGLGVLMSSGMDHSDFHYDPIESDCRVRFDYQTNEKASLLVVVFMVFLPLSITSICNGILFWVASVTYRQLNPHASQLNRKALVTVLTLTTVFVACWSVYVVFAVIDLIYKNEEKSGFALAGSALISVGVVANPVLYTLTNKRFYLYVQSFLVCGGDRGDWREQERTPLIVNN